MYVIIITFVITTLVLMFMQNIENLNTDHSLRILSQSAYIIMSRK